MRDMKLEELVKQVLAKGYLIYMGMGWYQVKELYYSKSRPDEYIEKEIWGCISSSDNQDWLIKNITTGLQEFLKSKYCIKKI